MSIRYLLKKYEKRFNNSCIKRYLSLKTYYDSQSGRYMAVPGTQAIQIHDACLRAPISAGKNVEIAAKYSSLLADLKISSIFWKDSIIDSGKINQTSLRKFIDHSTSVYLPFEYYKIIQKYNKDDKLRNLSENFTSFETDCKEHLPNANGFDLDSIIKHIETMKKDNSDLKFRVNLPIDVSWLIDSESEPAHASVYNIATTVGKLCDADVEVINFVLCSLKSDPEDDNVEAAMSDIEDYLRQVFEECIGLDVPGAAVIDRLSLLHAPSQLMSVASSLGIKRFTVLHNDVVPHSSSQSVMTFTDERSSRIGVVEYRSLTTSSELNVDQLS